MRPIEFVRLIRELGKTPLDVRFNGRNYSWSRDADVGYQTFEKIHSAFCKTYPQAYKYAVDHKLLSNVVPIRLP